MAFQQHDTPQSATFFMLFPCGIYLAAVLSEYSARRVRRLKNCPPIALRYIGGSLDLYGRRLLPFCNLYEVEEEGTTWIADGSVCLKPTKPA